MSQNITLLGASYTDVPSVQLPKTGGGLASFDDTTDANAVASDIAQGKTAYVNGIKLVGTSQGGGTEGYTLTNIVPSQSVTATTSVSANAYMVQIPTYTGVLEPGYAYLVNYDGDDYVLWCYEGWTQEYLIGDNQIVDSTYIARLISPFTIDYGVADDELVFISRDTTAHTIKVDKITFISPSGGNAFNITLALTNGEWVPNKTFAQIEEAYENGDIFVFDHDYTSYNSEIQTYYVYIDDETPNYLNYWVSWYDGTTNNMYVDFYAYDSDGVWLTHRDTYQAPKTLVTKTITQNGTYNASSDNADGYSSVTVNVSGGSGAQFASGTITLESAVSGPGSGQSKLFPGLQLPFKPDFLYIWYDKTDFYNISSPGNNKMYRVTAIRNDSTMLPFRLSASLSTDTAYANSDYLFFRSTTTSVTSDTPNGYSVDTANGAPINISTYPTWSINDDGTFSLGRFSSSAWSWYAGHYHYIAYKG